MLTYDLNKSGKLPKYDYLYQCIRDDIISGKIKSNEQLPSKRALANHLSIGLRLQMLMNSLLLKDILLRRKESDILFRNCLKILSKKIRKKMK